MPSSYPAPLAGRFAIITGGSRGIGRAIALDFAAKGAAGVAITYVSNNTAANDTVSQLNDLGVKAVAIQANLSSSNFGESVVHSALQGLQTDKLHVIVNNAAVTAIDLSLTFEAETKAHFDQQMTYNVWASFDLIRAAIPHIAPSGRIINISSGASRVPNPDGVAFYGASKAALESLTRSLAMRYAPSKKLTVNSVVVGPTNTDAAAAFPPEIVKMMADLATAEPRIGEPNDVASIVSFLASEESRWINGNSIPADGGASSRRGE